MMICALAAAIPSAARTPEAGDRAQDFALTALDGSTVRLSEAYASNPVVLVVLRGFPGYQCPLCNRQVQDFFKNAEGFANSGARVIMVYPGPAQDLETRAREFLTGKTVPNGFDLLIDPDYKFTNQYGLRWDASKETAYPSTFVIDRGGIVFFAKVSKSHGDRTTAAAILDVLQKHKKSRQ
jgi:peroxiredoxin